MKRSSSSILNLEKSNLQLDPCFSPRGRPVFLSVHDRVRRGVRVRRLCFREGRQRRSGGRAAHGLALQTPVGQRTAKDICYLKGK